MKFALGSDYDVMHREFRRPRTYLKFDDLFEFREYELEDRIRWTTFTITLDPVVDGNATSSVITATDFRDH
ncbi:MAG: hypothetical protein ACMG6H_05750 [Acidobacteriota bacterium]